MKTKMIDDSPLVLSHGEHAGFKFCVLNNGMGHRCGYICLPPEHPWHNKDYDSIDASVHGGLTFCEQKEDGFWIGFDCAHLDDAADPSLPAQYRLPDFGRGGVIRTQEYVESECRSLCQQAEAAAKQNKA